MWFLLNSVVSLDPRDQRKALKHYGLNLGLNKQDVWVEQFWSWISRQAMKSLVNDGLELVCPLAYSTIHQTREIGLMSFTTLRHFRSRLLFWSERNWVGTSVWTTLVSLSIWRGFWHSEHHWTENVMSRLRSF